MVTFLLSSGADVSLVDSKGYTCLHKLVCCSPRAGEWKRHEIIMEEVPRIADELNMLPCEYPQVLKALVDAKADLSARGPDGETPLMAAALIKNIDAVNALLAAGALPNDISDEGRTALTDAARGGSLGIVEALISAGADVDKKCCSHATPLIIALHGNHADIVAALIAAGADVNSHPYDQTPLDVALAKDKTSIASILVHAGGMRWKHYIMENNALFCANGCLGCGMSRETACQASQEDKENALKVAVVNGDLANVQWLLDIGVNPAIKFRGRSLLCEASSWGDEDVVRELIDAGVDINAKDNFGKTAVQYAAMGKHRDIVALLLAKTKELKNVNK
jgi:ankyrin repeat protein